MGRNGLQGAFRRIRKSKDSFSGEPFKTEEKGNY